MTNQVSEREHISASLNEDVALRPLGGKGKRVFDFGLVLLTLTIVLPVFILLAACIRASGPGPVLFRQKRVGFSGQPFECIKFRSMVVDGDALLEKYLAENPEAAQEWAETRKLKNDPRVTWIGEVLRKTSLDELPQLINVVRGEMSLVGPRPIVFDEIELYGKDFKYYQCARPGITGAWQTGGRSETSYSERVRQDVEYVRNWSFWQDLRILLLTVPAVISSHGSY